MRSGKAFAFTLTTLLLLSCEGERNGVREFADQANAIARHGPSSKAALKRRPARRLIGYYEPGEIVDVPHELIYDPTDTDIDRVIALYAASEPGSDNCDISGERAAPDFFDLTVACH